MEEWKKGKEKDKEEWRKYSKKKRKDMEGV